MKLKEMAAMLLLCTVFVSCDDTTDTIGQSLTDNMDHVQIATDTFTVSTRSIQVDSVLSRSSIGHVGRVKDPETGAYLTGDFTVQFNLLENFELWDKDSLYSYHFRDSLMANGLSTETIFADSCEVRFFFDKYYGDSLAPMKATLYELEKPLEESVKYYSNFDPIAGGLVCLDANALKKEKSYTLMDYTITKSEREGSYFTKNIHISLNEPYTDKDGKTYSNYGTYILQMYYQHPEYFKNTYSFLHHVCPGFYLKSSAGLGSMAYINMSEIEVYFRYYTNDTIQGARLAFSGTEEVLQTTKITNDKTISELVADNRCTYLKTPAGIFTEMTLPVEEIMRGHNNDTLNTAKVSLTRINNEARSDYELSSPTTLLMIQKDSLYTYFENGNIPDNKESYVTSTTTSSNVYTFYNISNLIRHMYNLKQSGKASADWNKVVLIPVEATSSTTSTIAKVAHDMSLSSTRLVGGSENPYDAIKINVIYSKFSDK